ncbi:MAG: hypothetical protein C0504_10960 [Candidatus Solibacter sp.]|nr:hypothetical protein [Candidatus Solibacter sp.]
MRLIDCGLSAAKRFGHPALGEMFRQMRRGWLIFVLAAAPVFGGSRPEVLVWWPEADLRAVGLLKQIAADTLLTPLESIRTAEFASRCRETGLAVIGTVRGGVALPGAIERAGHLQLRGVAIEEPEDAGQMATLARLNPGLRVMAFLKTGQMAWDVSPAEAVVRGGNWPGIHAVDVGSAGASEKPWVDANAYLYAYLRGMYPNRPALAGYRPDKDSGVAPERGVPHSSVEMGIAEARAAGGNWIISLPDLYREGLLKGDARATAAWNRLARTLDLLAAHQKTLDGATAATTAIIGRDWDQAYELLNMSYRNNLFPKVIHEDRIGALAGSGLRVVAAASVSPKRDGQSHLLGFAKAGGTLVLAPIETAGERWWSPAAPAKPPAEKDQHWQGLGAGSVLVNLDPVIDPGEFALDLIDALRARHRDLRIWNAPAVLGMVHHIDRKRSLLTLINYGGAHRDIVMVRVAGTYGKAVLRRPGLPPAAMEAKSREGATDLTFQVLEGVALIELERGG